MREIIYVSEYPTLRETIEYVDCIYYAWLQCVILPWQLNLGPIRNVNTYSYIPIESWFYY